MNDDNSVGIHSGPVNDENSVGIDQWPTLYPVDDTPDEQRLRTISARRKRQADQLAATRAEERAAVLAALASGTKQVRITAITGFTREYIRRMTKPDDGGSQGATGS